MNNNLESKKIINMLYKINNKLEIIESDIKDIKNKIDNELNNHCKKMGEHIDFIEEVYDNVKNPLGYLCKTISYYSNNENYELDEKESEKSKELEFKND